MVAESRSSNRKLLVGGILVLVVIMAAGLYWYTSVNVPKGNERVFYVVVYHWGYVFYDENFNEINNIVVDRGDIVTLYLIPGGAFKEEIHEQYQDRTLATGIGDLPPESPEIREKIEEAEEMGYLDHGLAIEGYNVNVRTNHKMFKGIAESIDEVLNVENEITLRSHSITFVADTVGTFSIMCTVYCGYGHDWMVVDGGFIVRG